MSEAELSYLMGYLDYSVPAVMQVIYSILPLAIVIVSALAAAMFLLKVIRFILSIGKPAEGYRLPNDF